MQPYLPPHSNQPSQRFRPPRGFEQQEKVLELLANATGVLAGSADYQRAIDCIATLMVKDFATWCIIDLVQENGTIDRVAAAHRNPEMSELIKVMLNNYPPNPNAGQGVYKAVRTRTSIFMPHYSDAQWAERAESADHLELILRLGSSSYIIVPLIARNEVVGSIMLMSGERTFDQDDLQAAEHFASWIAIVVDNIAMFKKMQSTLLTLEATQTQLIQSSKLAALGVISSGIAHEINNPLAIIRLSSEKIWEMVEKPTEQISGYFTKLQHGIDRIVRIIEGVNAFSRTSGPALSPVDLNDIVEKSVSFLEEHARAADTEVEFVSHHKGIIVNGASSRLEQVILNVITNAIHAIKDKKAPGKIRVGLWKTDSNAELLIEDDGVGIDPSIRDRIFEPFFTTKGAKGSGLGLSISLGIIQDHGGELKFESIPSQGTQVKIKIPLLMS